MTKNTGALLGKTRYGVLYLCEEIMNHGVRFVNKLCRIGYGNEQNDDI